MATQIGQPARSRRFIKLYLSTWALLASGALAYLAVLAYPAPDAETPAPQARVQLPKSAPAEVPDVKIRQVKTTEVKSPSEAPGSLSEIRKDATQPQEAVVAQASPNAPEERVAAVDKAQEPPPATPTTATPTSKVPGISLLPIGEPRPAGEAPFKPTEETPAPIQTPAAQTPAAQTPPAPGAPIETGSIPKAEIVFGEPVVTRAGAVAVQLAAAPSLQAARQSWEQLSDQHGLLTTLQPRVIAPREEGGAYRLLAGPLPTKADAVRICSQLGIGKACFATQYTGAPL